MLLARIALFVAVVTAADTWRQLRPDAAGLFSDGVDAQPLGRRNAAVWCVKEDNVYLLGGKAAGGRVKDMWRYEETTDRWIWLGEGPRSASGMAHWTPGGGRLWMYGGRHDDGSVLAELWVYDVATRTWTQQATTTQATPGPRYGAITWYNSITQTLYLYGGKNSSHDLCQDMWAFDMRAIAWRLVANENPPGYRDDARAAVSGATAYVVGGEGADVSVWMYSMNTHTWTRTAGPPAGAARIQDHAVWLDSSGSRLHVAGGRFPSGEISAQVYTLTLESKEWSSAPFPGISRWGSAACQDPEGYLFFVGGVAAQSTYLSDVWKHGQRYSRIQDFISSDAAPAIVAAVMSTLAAIFAATFGFILCIMGCAAARRAKRAVVSV